MTIDATAITALGSNSLVTITIQATGFVSVTASTTITLTGTTGISNAGTSTSGGVQVSGGTLTLNGNGSGTTTVSQTGTNGYCIVTSSTAALTISNSGGTAVAITATGRGVSYASSGKLTVTGAVTASTGTATGILISSSATYSTGNGNEITGAVSATTAACVGVSTAGTKTLITGNVSATGTATTNAVGVSQSGGAATINGELSSDQSSGPAYALQAATAGSLTWTAGSGRTLGSAGVYTDCMLRVASGGTLVISSVQLTCYGRFLIYKTGTGALTAAGTLITLQDQHAMAMGINIDLAAAGTAGASIVAIKDLSAGNVKNGVTIYGVAVSYTGGGGGGGAAGIKTGGQL